MFWIFIQKELKAIIQSPKFILYFITITVLILLSFYFGIKEFRAYERDYETAINLMEERNKSVDSWVKIVYMAYRAPNPMQIFSSGIGYDLGRYSKINQYNTITLENSLFTDNPIFAVFRFIDFTFIVTVILSLFAILFTFDSVNGEKEQGTMKLIFSNPVSRSQYIRGKFVGTFIGLVVPILIPVLFGLLMLIIFNVPLTFSDWMKILLILSASVLYLAFFIALGIFISTITHFSSTSFLISLVFWITTIFILPRLGIMTAGQLLKVPSDAEIESQKDAIGIQVGSEESDSIRIAYKNYFERTRDLSEDERKNKRSEVLKEVEQIQQSGLNKMNVLFEKIIESAQNKKNQVIVLGLTMSRFSPASAYQLAAMTSCASDVYLKNRTEEQMKSFKQKYTEFIQKKLTEKGGALAYYQSVMDGVTRKNTIDLADLPRYTSVAPSFGEVITTALLDITILIILTLAIFTGAYFSFLKYDLR